ncbi:BREX-1 system adenine-specific DNA-methyltransferase PglX [Mycobacteroides chelonae]|uniref:BREX-1 system adenine-specific DNA-methyltransferase PglX n=1 Tax=Mycobacteroides chelonae TaxID=1774 RepID=UPI0018B051F8|nr:BREX-1 system adenine-specific DNA-methyltransferase PglX [Mycobacteroides chelonae]MBF9317341.1 BREX-1 system adenine-specific DNA-methyltransferase PglX [Mycobacteroides chelonae]
METAPLKAFATSARSELISEVTARITAVLAQGSPERVENPTTVAGLEKAVAAGGGGDEGKAHVADKVAYTWFNRIIALRFMDANGYTGIGVVSPASDQVGQPEVLAAAKRGQVDKEVVSNNHDMAAIAGLLNGTRQPRLGVDAQAEAYSLLLATYCRFWQKAMPFMFERQGDFTELLIPANLLAGDSVLNRSVEVLTEDACKDVEVIGWLYQFYISERKGEVFAGFKKNKKAGADEIPAATQLFTPHWIVRYLVENSVGRLWMMNHPDSNLVDRMDYYIAPVDEETDFLKIAKPEEIKVIDPACGSGHMLTYAFDLIYAIYEEVGYAPSEIPSLILENNLYGTEIDPRAGALAAFALTMKAAAKRKLFLKKPVDPNICALEPISFGPSELDYLVTTDGDRDAEEQFWNQFAEADTFGALIRPDAALASRLTRHLKLLEDGGDIFKADAIDRAWRALEQGEYLAQRYSVVVANPPYMGRGNMGETLTDFVDLYYPNASWGLDACFIARAGSMVVRNGLSALVTMQSWMYLSSFEQLRRHLLETRNIETLCHLGTGVFDSFGGEVVAVVATIFRHASVPARGTYLRLLGEGDREPLFRAAASDPSHPRRFDRSSTDFLALRGALLAYFADSAIAGFLTGSPIRNYVQAGVGSQTGANGRYVRYWFEVARSELNLAGREGVDRARWTPSTKGGEFRRWYDPTISVMDWRDNGGLIKRESPGAVIRNASMYFRENLSWTKIGTRIPSFRYSDARVVHNDASCFVVARNTPLDSIAAYLNCRTVTSLVKELNPTLNLRPAALLDFPFVEVSPVAGKTCRELSKRDWDRDELSLDFVGSVLVSSDRNERLENAVVAVLAESAAMTDELARAENAIEREVASAAGLPEPDEIPWDEHSLLANPSYRYGAGRTAGEYQSMARADLIRDLVSHAVGCMLGRYSLDEPGLILADQGAMLQDYLAKVPSPTFMPDEDNVIPIVDGDWFEDDIVGRFRQFLRVTFGEKNFEENLRFVAASLGVKNLREYFITKAGKSKFYDDHVQRYKKRPIYWLFSSPKGSFNALIYLHRYTPSAASTVLTYLREYVTKLESSLQQAERAGNAKEADRLRKILVELNEYEHDTLYPKASENVVINLDDGVKVNYPKLGGALRKIAGLESSGD